ncbi:unnamed protein product [Alopecurus aequalis]
MSLRLLLPPRGSLLLLSPLRRRQTPTPPPFRSTSTAVPPRTCSFFGLPIRAFTGVSAMAAEAQQRTVEVRESVELTEEEERIFGRLLDVVRHFGLGTQVRVAGGWVRDKLLGKDSTDIDIALDNMTGQNFCERVNEYSKFMGEEQKGIGVIQCNPDQSKHLETATMLIYGTWIDFVNLRSEKYAENSRIPTVEIGTAKEDAFRRDLTINSLFYNINTKSVEDLTERGLEDLKKGLIATPLPAKSTFLDDPLRVLRAIRFAARFSFTLTEDLKEAASDENVKSELGTKISRERIGHEDEQQRLCLYSALFIPVRNTVYMDKKSKKVPVVSYIIRDSLKLKASDADTIVNIHVASEKFAKLVLLLESNENLDTVKEKLDDEYLEIPTDTVKRVLAGLILREIKGFWRVALFILTLVYPEGCNASGSLSKQDELHRRKEKYLSVERSITDLDLDGVWRMKPLLDGKAIMGVLEVKSGGPLIGKWQQRLVKWQLAHPKGTMEECKEWMKQSQQQTKRQKVECSS